MGWEDRHGSRYYYRKQREGKRVVSEYVGSGLIGQLAQSLDIEGRFEADLARIDFREQKENVKVINNRANEVENFTKAMMRAVLLLSGYHSHKRQWRKCRDVKRNNNNP